MQIHLLINRGRLVRWHVWLAAALTNKGLHHVTFILQPPQGRWAALPTSYELMLGLERLVFRFSGEHAADTVDIEVAGYPWFEVSSQPTNPDLIINVSSNLPPPSASAVRILTPLFDGAIGELPLLAGFLELRPIEIAISDSARPGRWWGGRPALEQKHKLLLALDNIYASMVQLVLLAVANLGTRTEDAVLIPARTPGYVEPFVVQRATAEFLLKRIQIGLGWRLGLLTREPPRWSVAYRAWDGQHMLAKSGQQQRPFAILPDDGRRYYADPFTFERQGTSYIFCEEFSFEQQRGVISVSKSKSGNFGRPEVVLEELFHLSYPFIFEEEGEIWMIPESAEANRVALYRAVNFPNKWELNRVLVDGVRAYDATIVRTNDSWWMLMSTRRWQSSGCDNIEIYSASSLKGRWTRVFDTPQLIDARAARSAGSSWTDNGQLFRPAQDCSDYYGGGLSVCRVDQLNMTGYRQTIIANVTATTGTTRLGVHTLNAAGKIEVIDVFGPMDHISSATLTIT